MNDRTGDFITVLADERTTHRVSDDPDAHLGHHRRAWHGDVFFDHVRGVLDPDPAPLVVPRPYLLVTHYRDFDWTARHDTRVEEFATAGEVLSRAQAMVAGEKASGSSNVELWEVYAVRVLERRPRAQRPRLVDGVDARLLEDIRNAPDDDAPRLVWADAIGGERGELVVIQIDLARGGLSAREVITRKKRQRELLGRHGAEWTGLAGLARRASFARGFVDAAEVPAGVFLEHADEIVEAAPLLSSLTTSGFTVDGPLHDPIPMLSKLCADPAVRQLRGLDVSCETSEYIDDRLPGELALETIVASGVLRQLRALGTRDALGMHGARTLASTRALHELERLWLSNIRDVDAMRTLLASGVPALRSLDLGATPAPQVAGLVPPTVTELFVGRLTHEGLTALAATPIARTLDHLEVQEGHVDLALFAAFPRLRALWIHEPLAIPSRIPVGAFAALREFANTLGVREDHARLIAAQLGSQLELLDLRNSAAALRYVNDLKAKVAGELRVGDMPHAERQHPRLRAGLLRVGPSTQMPWWDHVSLE